MKTILPVLLLLAFSAQAQLRFVKEVANVAALKQLNTADVNKSASVKGYVTNGDGGGGVFEFDPTITTTDLGIRIAPNVGTGAWVRKVDGRDYMARWWGPVKTNATLQAAIDWVSANGYGKVIADGGTWTVKCDDSTRITIKSGVTLTTAPDSQLLCAPNPTNNWIMVDFPLDVTAAAVGPARLVGWNLGAPGGDTNLTGVIFSLQDTVDVTIGGVRASNWYSQYADVGSNNQNLQMFDADWQLGAMSFGAAGDGVTDDRRNLQSYAYFCERYSREFFMRPTTNGYLIGGSPGSPVGGGVYFTNNIPVKLRGDKTIIKSFYYNPTEGTLPHLSSAFIITANNCSVQGFDFRTVGTYPTTETNASVTGYFVPLIIHMGTNTLIQNNTFTVESGKGVTLSGASYTQVINNTFNDCGLSTGNGHYPDWLYYEAAVPIRGGPSRSPIGCVFRGNIFNRGSPYKHVLFLSAADDFLVDGNYFVDMNTLTGPLVVYSGDEGTTDERGTNVYKVSGTIRGNFISGTNFGADAAIWVRLGTPTNYVPSTFNPSNMYSAITIQGNHINGGGLSGRGIEILSAQGTKIINNDVRVGGNPIYHVGNVNDLLVDGGHYEATNASTGSTFHFATGFLQPSQFKRVIYRNAELVSPAGDEAMFRNVEPDFVDSLTIENCDLRFNGAAGGGDYPQLFQWTISTNFINFNGNRIYLGPSMSNRRLGIASNTNAVMVFDNNLVIANSSLIQRGPLIRAPRLTARGNNVGSFELYNIGDGLLLQNHFTSGTNSIIPLAVYDSDQVAVVGNTIINLHTNAQLAVTMSATNSTFTGNIVDGYSTSDIVRNETGKMYVSDNVIRNRGTGFGYVTTNAPGRIAHSQFERSFMVEGSDTGPIVSFYRALGGGSMDLTVNNWFTGSSRDALYTARPVATNDQAGHAFFVNKTNGLAQYAFGAHGFNPPVFYIGDSSNSIITFIGGVTTNSLLYLDNDHYLKPASLGANMTFSAGTLNSVAGGGGGSTNDTPWNLDHDGNQFALTNVGTVWIRHNDASLTYLRASNTSGSSLIGTLFGGMVLDTSNGSSTFDFKFNGTSKSTLSAGGLFPATDGNQTLGDATHRYVNGFLYGVNLPGATITSGGGSPEGVITAPVSSVYHRTNGTAGLVLYVKETGVGNTGWVAYKSGATGTVPTTFQIACSDLTTPITAGTGKAYLRMPYAMTGVTVRASLFAAQTAGSIFTVQVQEGGVNILSTPITIDSSEKTSTTAATPPVVSDSSLADDAEITVSVTQAGTSPLGLILTVNGFR